MIRICIVGDIGSGKSYVAKQFKYPVFVADNEVIKIYRKSRKYFKKLKKIFPNYIVSFPINKKELSQIIMGGKNNIKKIIKIIHPEVRLRMNKFLKKNKKKKIEIKDKKLLLEGKINNKKDVLIFVDAKKKEISKRLKKRPNFNKKIFNKLRKLQLPLKQKKKKSNFIIKNNFKSFFVKKNVKNILRKILKNDRSSS